MDRQRTKQAQSARIHACNHTYIVVSSLPADTVRILGRTKPQGDGMVRCAVLVLLFVFVWMFVCVCGVCGVCVWNVLVHVVAYRRLSPG